MSYEVSRHLLTEPGIPIQEWNICSDQTGSPPPNANRLALTVPIEIDITVGAFSPQI